MRQYFLDSVVFLVTLLTFAVPGGLALRLRAATCLREREGAESSMRARSLFIDRCIFTV